MWKRALLIVFMAAFAIVPAFGKTYKTNYPNSCGDLWNAVKDTLTDKDNYAQLKIFDAEMKADYQPRHSVHVDVSGTLLQRINHVRLVPQGNGCRMEVVSNYSGWGQNDQGDFRKRVESALAKRKNGPGAQPAAPGSSRP